MGTELSKREWFHRCLTWFVFVFFSLFMLVTSLICGWVAWVNVYVILMIAAVSYVTWNKRFSDRVQSYVFVVASMLNIFGYSVLDDNFYASMVVVCCLAAMTAVYMDAKLMFLLFLLSVVQVVSHICIFHTVTLSTPQDVLSLIIRVLATLFAELFLIYFVNRLYWIEVRLKTSLEEARKADRSKADFLANMSHEIRTPMNVIVGMCELILRDDINEEVRENCINIQHSGRSLLAIINDILDFSKLDSGKTELVNETFNIGSMVNDVMNMAMTRKGDKKLEIIARIDPEIPKGLVGDEVRIRQVIINLMTNAVKFTKEGCVVLKITQNRHDYGINLNVSVSDTGIGITEEDQEKLFTSFQQVDTRKNRTEEGTGLGLAICKHLVAQMGGFINVSSTYGKGSTFRFVIPLRVSDAEPFIGIKDTSGHRVAIFVDMKKFKYLRIAKEYMKMIRELGEKFRTELRVFDSMDTLKHAVETEEYTHCFVGRDEYLQNAEKLEQVAENLRLFVVQERNNAVSLSGNVKCIYKPFYAMSIAAVLNNEKYMINLNERKAVARFVAPEARILIVDDNLTNLKVAEGLMRPYNMKITTALSGREALDYLGKTEYDMIFMDHMMPELDGVETTALIRQMEGEYYKKVPIIALTANAVNGAREMFLSAGFNDFIAKPIELSHLDRVLRAWLLPGKIHSVSVVKKEEVEGETTVPDGFREVIQEEKGLMYAGHSRAVYYENLYTYLKNGPEYRESLQKRYEEEDWPQYIIEVHAVKSSSLSIGAVGLSELAKTLEFAGKEERFELIVAKQRSLIKLYDRVLRKIGDYLRENGYEAKEKEQEAVAIESLSELSEERLDEYVEQLVNACDNFDGEGIVLIAKLLSSYVFRGNVLADYFVPIAKLAEDFEYGQAMEEAKKAHVLLKEAEE